MVFNPYKFVGYITIVIVYHQQKDKSCNLLTLSYINYFFILQNFLVEFSKVYFLLVFCYFIYFDTLDQCSVW